MRVSLTKKIFFNFLILSIVPIIIIDTYFYYKSKDALIDRTFDQLTTVRIEKTTRLKDFFNQSFNDINLLTNYSVKDSAFCCFNKYDDKIAETFQKQIKNNIVNDRIYKKLILITQDNNIWYFDINDSSSLKSFKSTSIEYESLISSIKQTRETEKPQIYDVKNSYTSKHHSILLINKVYKDNLFKGAIILEISLNAINRIMYENNPHNGLGKTGETYLVGSDYYMRSTSRFKDNSVFNIKVETIGVKEAFNNIVGTKQILDYRKIPVLSSYSKVNISGLNWVVLAEIDTKEAMVPIYLIRNDILFMSLILSILLLGLVEILASKITAPVKKLKQVTDRISEGELGKFVDAKSNDEIGDLIFAFNKMIAQLEDQSIKLEEERKLRIKSLFDGQEIERQRLSRELHDSLGQSILALKMKFERIRETSEEKRLIIISETEELFMKIMTEIRNISNDLMPAVLTEFGLLMAIKKIIREFSANTNIEIEFNSNITDEIFDNKIETHIYRIVQEALSNIHKHSQATKIELVINKIKANIELAINDNGNGFILNKDIKTKGNGISNIKERINLLGGKIDYISEINKGTSINCIIPIK